MKCLTSLFVVAVAGWVSAGFASPGPPAGGPPSKMIECCACFDYRDVQTGCDKHDCPVCPIHRHFPSLE
jgi:hypothetical protein